MTFSAESELMLAALALYLYDSLLMLSSNEAVLVRGWRGRWHAGFGAQHWRLAGKEPYLPNPLLPHRAHFRLAWHWDRLPTADATSRQLQAPKGLTYLAVPVYLSALGLFVVLPLGLFSRLGLPIAVLALALMYLCNIANLLIAFWLRQRLGIPSRLLARIAFECLVCPPYALNLVRRICEAQPSHEDFALTAARLLPAPALAMAHAQCLMRLDEHIDFEHDDSPHLTSMQQARARFLPPPENAI